MAKEIERLKERLTWTRTALSEVDPEEKYRYRNRIKTYEILIDLVRDDVELEERQQKRVEEFVVNSSHDRQYSVTAVFALAAFINSCR